MGVAYHGTFEIFPSSIHRQPPDAAGESVSAAVTGPQEAAQRFPEGREKAARRRADDSDISGRRPLRSARRQPGSRFQASRRSPLAGSEIKVLERQPLLEFAAKF